MIGYYGPANRGILLTAKLELAVPPLRNLFKWADPKRRTLSAFCVMGD